MGLCRLPLSERTTIFLGWLASSNPACTIQVDRQVQFCHRAHLHSWGNAYALQLQHQQADYCTGLRSSSTSYVQFVQVDQLRASLPVVLQNNASILSLRWLPHKLLAQTKTWITRAIIQARLLFRSIEILFDHNEPHNLMELANVLASNDLTGPILRSVPRKTSHKPLILWTNEQ